MITKETITICDNITEAGHVGVKTITRVMEDGVKLSETIHRKVLSPGDDITGEPESVQAVARGIWTPAVVAPFTTAQQASIAELAAKTTAAATAKAEVDAEAAALAISTAAVQAQRSAVDTETAALTAKQAELAALKGVDANGVPQSVDMVKAEIYFGRIGVLTSIKAAVTAAGAEALTIWDRSKTIQRQNKLMLLIAHNVLMWTDAEIDFHFIEANKVEI